jgi:hypothetical protein
MFAVSDSRCAEWLLARRLRPRVSARAEADLIAELDAEHPLEVADGRLRVRGRPGRPGLLGKQPGARVGLGPRAPRPANTGKLARPSRPVHALDTFPIPRVILRMAHDVVAAGNARHLEPGPF